MKTCDTCTHYKPRFIPCYGCHNNDGWEPKPQTHGDRIRAMTDEELASIIMKYVDCNLCRVERGHCDKDYAECKGAWLDWLRQEATT